MVNANTLKFGAYVAERTDWMWPESVERNPATILEFALGFAQAIERTYWPAWREHPAFIDGPIWNPAAVLLIEHLPGESYGYPYSYVISNINDLVGNRMHKWVRRTLGIPKCFKPITPEWPVSETRILYISNSLHGAGKGFRSREVLKTHLPKQYHRLINAARRYGKKAKMEHLPPEWRKAHYGEKWTRSIFPDWYNAKTRDTLNFEAFADANGLEELDIYISPLDFWRSATGQLRPDDVEALMKVRQLTLWE